MILKLEEMGFFMEKKRYKTAGREALIDYLSQNPDRQFTVEELCLAVNGDLRQGRSSVYRQLGDLCRDEAVRKFQGGDGRGSVYQYVGRACDCNAHFHEKCTRCGSIRHLECGDADGFVAHLLAEHGFAVDRGQSVLYGLCSACRETCDAEGGRA